jgi:NTE family protein
MARGKPPYRQVPYLLVAPKRRYELGAVAADVLRTKHGGLRVLRDPDLQLLSRLLGRESPAHAELFSYLFFDPDFLSELIAMGRADARRWLASAAGPNAPWRLEPLEAFGHRGGMGAAGMRPRAA